MGWNTKDCKFHCFVEVSFRETLFYLLLLLKVRKSVFGFTETLLNLPFFNPKRLRRWFRMSVIGCKKEMQQWISKLRLLRGNPK